MIFSQFRCPECGENSLHIYNSIIDESKDPAIGFIAFKCIGCGNEFEIEMEAVIEK